MIRVCPTPPVWVRIHQALKRHATAKGDIPEPPMPLILAGWNFSDDSEKAYRWSETIEWIAQYGGPQFINELTDDDFYMIDPP